MEPLSRIVLEQRQGLFAGDWVVVATCISGGLYVGRCDYGDGDDSTEGFDITPVDELLSWLVRDRFCEDADGLIEYAQRKGLPVSLWEKITDPSDLPVGLSVVVIFGEGDAQITQVGLTSARTCRVSKGCVLALSLLADRCQGSDALDRVERVVAMAGVTAVPRDRGYV